MMRVVILLAVACIAVTTSAQDALWSGNSLLLHVSNPASPEARFWFGYISAVADQLENEGIELEGAIFRTCRDQQVTHGQIWVAVEQQIRKRPETWHNHSRSLIIGALLASFPCADTEGSSG